jgi:hypothetical protein
MSTLATRLEKIEAQTNDIITLGRAILDAIQEIVMESADTNVSLRSARDQLATVASPYDLFAQYCLEAAAVMLGEVEMPKLSNHAVPSQN